MIDFSLSHALRIMLAETSLSSVLNSIWDRTSAQQSRKTIEKERILEESFCQKCVATYPWLSFSDALEVYRAALAKIEGQGQLHPVFIFLRIVAQEFLHEDGGVLVCQHDSFIAWRESIHEIGQSPFICAYWAWKDKNNSSLSRPCDFPPYVKTDNLRLQQILAKGMAENHFHLKGSAPVFLLSWVCLMNNIENRKTEFSQPLLKHRFFNNSDKHDLHHKVLQAAYIRFYLWWKYLHIISHPRAGNVFSNSKQRDDDLKVLIRYLQRPVLFIPAMQRIISIRRLRYRDRRLDYAGTPQYARSPYGPLEGEHRFLYCIFRELYSGKLSVTDMTLLYAYLLIAIELRRELVQVNNTVGFSNFSKYQDRKEVFLERYGEYKDALVRMAHASVLGNPSIQCLEARVTPKNSSAKLHRSHKKMEQLAIEGMPAICRGETVIGTPIPYFPSSTPAGMCRHFNPLKNSCRRSQGPCRISLARLSYVHHFIKKPEPWIDWSDPVERLKAIRQCRHFAHRRQAVELPAAALERWRNSGARQAARVHGIDACNFEIGCRPEVFAPAFRRLRSHVPTPLFERLYSWALPNLRVTFHVGEDFLDIVDGLRAIDEAIHFLELRYGDRLGHAIALGSDAPYWYAFKKGKVFLPKQDLLDNIAWFYCRLLRLGICNTELEHRLTDEYSKLYLEIFENTPVPISIYFEAWKLRGNHPKYFIQRDGYACPSYKFRLARFQHEVQRTTEKKSLVTTSRDVYTLVHRYHYDPNVRARGSVSKEYHICPLYIQAVTELQKKCAPSLHAKASASRPIPPPTSS